MHVFLDDKPLAVADVSIPSAIAAARTSAGAQGRVLVEAKLDGRDLGDAELSGAASATGQELRLTSADPKALVAYSLRDVVATIPNMRAAQGEAAGKLQAGEFEPALAGLSRALTSWESIRRVADEGPRLLNVDARHVKIGRLTLGEETDLLASLLSQMQTALRSQDWPALADLLEGELDQAAARWETLLTGLAERVMQSR